MFSGAVEPWSAVRFLGYLRQVFWDLGQTKAPVGKSTVATAPGLVKFACRYLESQSLSGGSLFSCKWPGCYVVTLLGLTLSVKLGVRLWVDTACLMVLRFRLKLTVVLHRSCSKRMVKASGLRLQRVAVIFALKCSGYLDSGEERRYMSLSLQGGTDKAIKALSKKRSSTKWPLILVSIQLSHLTMERGLRLSLKSRPRDESEPAEALTNGDFSGFDESQRHQVVWNDVELVFAGFACGLHNSGLQCSYISD